MHVKRFADAKPYEAPNHRAYSSLRLFGADAGGTKGLVFGISHFLPGGGAGPDASPPEKVYLVLAGELTVIVNGKETVLKPLDSCVIEPNETREIINRGNDVCTIAVAVATPPAPAATQSSLMFLKSTPSERSLRYRCVRSIPTRLASCPTLPLHSSSCCCR